MVTMQSDYPCVGGLYEAILHGTLDTAVKAVRTCLKGNVPLDAVEQALLAVASDLGPATPEAADRLRDLLRAWSPHLVGTAPPVEARPDAGIVLVTLPGDGHDAGRYLWQLLLQRRGYTTHDLGVRAPALAATRAISLQADAVALYVYDAGAQSAVQSLIAHLAHRSAKIPVLLGGPGVDEAFAQWVAIPQGGAPYWGGVYYCDDGLEMLQVLTQIVLFTPPPPAHTHEAPLADACGPSGCASCASCGLSGACELEAEQGGA